MAVAELGEGSRLRPEIPTRRGSGQLAYGCASSHACRRYSWEYWTEWPHRRTSSFFTVSRTNIGGSLEIASNNSCCQHTAKAQDPSN